MFQNYFCTFILYILYDNLIINISVISMNCGFLCNETESPRKTQLLVKSAQHSKNGLCTWKEQSHAIASKMQSKLKADRYDIKIISVIIFRPAKPVVM